MANAIVIDDSRCIRRYLAGTLSGLGFQVLEAANANEAVMLLKGSDPVPSLMTVDWNMPEVNGLELIQRLRAEPRYRRSTIIMVTSEVRAEQMAKALLAGADDYIMKPFTEEILRDKLALLGVHP